MRTPRSLGRTLFALSKAGLLQVVLTESVRTSVSWVLADGEFGEGGLKGGIKGLREAKEAS